MAYIDEKLIEFKTIIENAIITGGSRGKESAIRSSVLINLIHDAVKFELIQQRVDPNLIFPPLNYTKPEIKLAGFLKQKNQDVCVLPRNISRNEMNISWGPLAYESKKDNYGFEYSENCLVINIRSQMSSLGKNSDTLFERTFAEALNLHMRYHNIVLGEVYVIPAYEYDDGEVGKHNIAFKKTSVNVEKYISFFSSINGRVIGDSDYKYERCTLLVVDFRLEIPKLYRNNAELIADGLISPDFSVDYEPLNFDTFAHDILEIYASRFNSKNILL